MGKNTVKVKLLIDIKNTFFIIFILIFNSA